MGTQDIEDKSIRRDIVLSVAKQLFISLIEREENGVAYAEPEQCFKLAETWADAQIAYCERNEVDE